MCKIEKFAEHFKSSNNSCTRLILQTDDLNRLIDFDTSTLDTTSCNSSAASDCENVFNRHKEWKICIASWGWDVCVNCIEEFHDVIFLLWIIFFKSEDCCAWNDWNFIAREFITRKKIANFHFDKLEEFWIINLINFVQEDNDCRNTNLTCEEDVLTSLRHRTIRCCNDKNCTIHLSCASDHVFDVVSVSRAVNMCIVTTLNLFAIDFTIPSLIFNVCGVDGDSTLALFWSFIDVCKIDNLVSCGRMFFCQSLGDSRSESGFTVIDVTDRADIDMRFASIEFLFCHRNFSSLELTFYFGNNCVSDILRNFVIIGDFH